MLVPFVDLRLQYESIHREIESGMADALRSFRFLKGQEVSLFEERFSSILNIRHCISTGNGTDALFLALKAFGIGPGDEVITPAFSWISSSETISGCGAKPVFVDVDPETYTLDPELIAAKLTPATRAIVAVHLYGQAACVSRISEICRQHGLFLIEDCAQAHLTAESDRYTGTIGDAGCFSFYPTKNLGAYGDAGCVVTASEKPAVMIRRLASHGALAKDDHEFEGINSRMDTLQAAVLLAKLPFLGQWNRQRRKLAALYSSMLEGLSEVKTPFVRESTTHTFHLYVIQAERRDELRKFLQNDGIETMIHYPKALSNLPAYRHLNHRLSDFPVASKLQQTVLSLPVYPELGEGKVAFVCERIRAFYKNGAGS